MRTLNSHKVNGLNEELRVDVLDKPGQGNVCHQYRISTEKNSLAKACDINFQNGPIDDILSINGISNEALLAVVEDRLKRFQSGEFACRENEIALTKIQEAMHWLHHRTRERMSRGVEGKNEV